MKILMVHKFYYVEGGAERYVFNLTEVLEREGHTVIPFAMHHERNQDSPYKDYFSPYFNPEQLKAGKNPVSILKTASRTVYNKDAQQNLSRLIKETQPDIAHVHSVYHHLTPSIFKTLKAHGLPVMLTLHDYKLVCPNYIFLDGKNRVCEACKGNYYFNATLRKCFRQSYAASFLVTVEAYLHKYLKSYLANIDLMVSPSRFLGQKIAHYGYADIPILVQPYTLDVDAYKPHYGPSDYIVFMGRLTHEKGVHFLLDAMKEIRGAQLMLVGTGPLESQLRQQIADEGIDNVIMPGYKSGEELRDLVSHAKFTVITSEWHDNSPLVIYESLSLGNAIVGARMGGIPELIEDGKDGFIYEPGNRYDFIEKVQFLIDHPDKAIEMGRAGHKKAEREYAPREHYNKIMDLYARTQELAQS